MTDGFERFSMLVGDQWIDACGGRRFELINPYDGQAWASVPEAGAADAAVAVQTARAAFTGVWGLTRPAQRAVLLRRLAAAIEDNVDELVRVQTLENGMPARDTRGKTLSLVGFCHFVAGLTEATHGDVLSAGSIDEFVYTVREPLGVVGVITPWNAPLTLFLWKVAPALGAGNTVVAKPSEVSPASTLVLARLMLDVGFPPGAVNVITGAREAGQAIVDHPDVAKIAFTGSTAAGKAIAGAASRRLARVSLELGGKSPNIIFADADLDRAAQGIIDGVFRSSGQSCISGSRVLIESSVYDDLAARVVAKAEALRLGDPFAPDTDLGPISCAPQYDKVRSCIATGVAEGAHLLTGGGPPEDPTLEAGLFVTPTIFGNVTNDMRIARDEVFGPVVCLMRFDTEEEAVRIANDTPYGLAAGVWTSDPRRIHRLPRRLDAGTVWVNTYRPSSHIVPIGGFKESGVGREKGLEALHEFTELKAVWVDTV